MDDDVYSEAGAAAALRPPVNPRTLRRWRKAGHVPYSATPGGRIFYTFAQVVEINAGMRVSAYGLTSPDMSGEKAEAAE